MRQWVRAAAAVTAVLLAVATAACASDDKGSVSVLGTWTGHEGDMFEQVLGAFQKKTGIKVRYTGTRAVGEVLASAVQRGFPPDVAVLPGPGELRTYVGHGLQPLDGVLDVGTLGPLWRNLQKLGFDRQYAVTVKADLKSLIWYNTKQFASAPATWSDLAGKRWCLGMEATSASGWPGTDWVEDLLLHTASDAYPQWASGKETWSGSGVSQAWQSWGEKLTAPGAVPGGLSTALLTNFKVAGMALTTDPPRCAANHQASFALADYSTNNNVGVTPFPDSATAPGRKWEVSADLAGMFNNTPQARKLLQYLASDDAQQIWPRNSGGTVFSANTFPPAVYSTIYKARWSAYIAAVLAGRACNDGPDWCMHPDQTTLCFDASGLMPSAVSSAFDRAIVEYLTGLDSKHTAPSHDLLTRLDTVSRAALNDSSRTGYWWNPDTVCDSSSDRAGGTRQKGSVA
jgi:alpha-glucoside transport system substrate-binding protein